MDGSLNGAMAEVMEVPVEVFLGRVFMSEGFGNGVFCDCPFCDKEGCFLCFDERTRIIWTSVCGDGGDIIWFTRKRFGIGFSDAVERLRKMIPKESSGLYGKMAHVSNLAMARVESSGSFSVSVGTGPGGRVSSLGPAGVSVAWGERSYARSGIGGYLVLRDHSPCSGLDVARIIFVDGIKYIPGKWYHLEGGKVVETSHLNSNYGKMKVEIGEGF